MEWPLPAPVWIAFLITLLAGLATGIGSSLVVFTQRTNLRFLSVALAFSAGVMLYVSFLEILPKAQDALLKTKPDREAQWLVTAAFFGGMLLIAVIDRMIPNRENPHETRSEEEIGGLFVGAKPPPTQALGRMGLLAAIAIGIHNFPEGIGTFFAALDDPRLGVVIGIAIALHNIPEGISVAVPIYYATGNRMRAFTLSFLSGLAEPVGAILGYLVLQPIMTPTLSGMLFASVAGVMVFVSLDELLPAARAYSRGHEPVYGILSGMAVMALSLLLLA